MAASVNDKFRLASGSTRPVVTSLALPKANGATTAELTSATGWNTTTGLDYVMYRRELNASTGQYVETSGTRVEGRATLSGTTLSNMTFDAGTEPAAGYAADGNTVVLCATTAQWGDDLVNGILDFANQDGTLKTSAVQTALSLGADSLNGWNALGYAPNTVTYNGNRSYDLVFNSTDLTDTVSAGMRLRTTRTVAAPTQCTSLNGTNQYYSKSSPAGMTFTDDFVVGGWIKLSAYPAVGATFMSRFNGTSGWNCDITSAGQIRLLGYNAGGSNYSMVSSYQSLPLNKWVHVALQLDMSAFTATTTTSYIMFDGVDVPASVTRAGTNPTALVQAGTLEIGSQNGGTFLANAKFAQTFVSSAKITQANVRTLISQGLTSSLITTHNIISAYSFNNSINDLNTTNANNLTANGSAVATNADSFSGGQADGTISSTLDYAIVQKASFSTNTTLTVQVPEGCTIPTSGGVTSVVYSSNKVPYGFPGQRNKWSIASIYRTLVSNGGTVTVGTYYNTGGRSFNLPVGAWNLGYSATPYYYRAATIAEFKGTLSTSVTAETDSDFTIYSTAEGASGNIAARVTIGRTKGVDISTATPYYLIYTCINNNLADGGWVDNNASAAIFAENSYL